MSGQLFNKTCAPIEASIAPYIQQSIINEILDIYPQLTIIPIGSVGKKNDYNSDIDIAIVTHDVDYLREIISTVFDYTESVTLESLYIVSIKYPYKINNEIKYVQCDFMNVWDTEYTKFRYYCPNYIKEESKYKVGQKIMFATMILNHCKQLLIRNEHTVSNFLFEPTGLFHRIIDLSKQTYTQNLVTLKPDVIATMCFSDGNTSHFNSVETLWDAIHSDVYKYPEEVKIIERNFFVNCYRKGWTNIFPEDFKLQYWTVEQIYEELNKFKYMHTINNIFANAGDMENK